MPNFATSAAFVDTATKCLETDFSSPPRPASDQARAAWALVIVSRVVNVFEEIMKSVSAGSRSRTASAKSVPSTFETKRNAIVAIAVMLQRLVGHHGPEVGAADPDVDDVANAFACVSFPFAAADATREIRHLVEDGMDQGHDVLSVHEDGRGLGRAQGYVQDGTFLREIDLVAAKHGIDMRPQAGLLRQWMSSVMVSSVMRFLE